MQGKKQQSQRNRKQNEGGRVTATSGDVRTEGNVRSDLGGADHDQIYTAQSPCHKQMCSRSRCTYRPAYRPIVAFLAIIPATFSDTYDGMLDTT